MMVPLSFASDSAAKSCCQRCWQVHVVTTLLSHAVDDTVDSDVGRSAMSLPRQLHRGMMSLPSHAGDFAADGTWL
jgi:hypothetical protein